MSSNKVMELYEYYGRMLPVKGSNYEYSGATLIRRGHAMSFKSRVELVKNRNRTTEERKYYISFDGCSGWNEDLHGISRISVHGIDSICVALRKEDVEDLRCEVRQVEDPALYKISEEYWIRDFHHTLKNAVIYEVEELAVPCSNSIEKLRTSAKHISMPFGVVSVIGHQGALPAAIGFLQEEMNSGTAFTFIKTVKTAIGALQHLFGEKLKANEIQVFVLRSDDDESTKFRALAADAPFVRYEPRRLPSINSEVKKLQMQYHGQAEEIPSHAERSIKDYLSKTVCP